MEKNRFHLVLYVLSVAVFAVPLFYATYFNWLLMRRLSSAQSSFKSLSEHFAAITNLNFSASSQVDSDVSPSSPQIVLQVVPGFGTYSDLHGRIFAVFDGLEYQRGDISPYGLVVLIKDGRCFCRDGDVINVVRPGKPPEPEPDKALRSEPESDALPGDDSDGVASLFS